MPTPRRPPGPTAPGGASETRRADPPWRSGPAGVGRGRVGGSGWGGSEPGRRRQGRGRGGGPWGGRGRRCLGLGGRRRRCRTAASTAARGASTAGIATSAHRGRYPGGRPSRGGTGGRTRRGGGWVSLARVVSAKSWPDAWRRYRHSARPQIGSGPDGLCAPGSNAGQSGPGHHGKADQTHNQQRHVTNHHCPTKSTRHRNPATTVANEDTVSHAPGRDRVHRGGIGMKDANRIAFYGPGHVCKCRRYHSKRLTQPAEARGRERAPAWAGALLRIIPAASYSPGGPPPKYHRRWQA